MINIMYEYERNLVKDKYHQLKIYECPLEILLEAASLASQNVTVERMQRFNSEDEISVLFKSGQFEINPLLLRYNIDISIEKKVFLEMKNYWDKNGCYAVFHEQPFLKCIAGDLDEKIRYKVLDNFGWTLELSIPGPSSSGWAYLCSPDKGLIDIIEESIKEQQV